MSITGSFVFRDEGDGCLSSKYINRGLASPLVECSKINKRTTNEKFCGEYFSVWLDSPTDPNSSSLDISKNAGDFYDLTWTDLGGTIIYKGQGMLFGDLLVGCYWSI